MTVLRITVGRKLLLMRAGILFPGHWLFHRLTFPLIVCLSFGRGRAHRDGFCSFFGGHRVRFLRQRGGSGEQLILPTLKGWSDEGDFGHGLHE